MKNDSEHTPEEIPSDEMLEKLADWFKICGDYTRLRILFVLLRHEACVREIADQLDMTPSAISHQLRILKQTNFVIRRRSGQTMVYALADSHVSVIFRQAIEHISE